MFKKIIIASFITISVIACNNKDPYRSDYENAVGIIIGREDCKNLSSANAWLVQFTGPNTGSKVYGESIVLNGVSYSNAVKTYQLPDSSKVLGKRYLFEFYLDGKGAPSECEAPSLLTFNIETIRIKNIAALKF